ncbi:MAG: fibrobacter succinogenes major paralogous domain-containing protein [Bacteroidia bacterium]|nr:fibrobacter succinogenes major paralogous domain-containing protein [Bacteroidia bacterium]
MKNLFRISGVILSIVLIYSCKKDPTPPVISTTTVTAISYTTATSGGAVTNEGGASVTARGVCWNTSLDPTTTNNKTTDGTGTGGFNSSLTGLIAGTTYYVRAYATNIAGTGYGNQISFTTSTVATVVPALTTTAASSITSTTATSGGNITSDGGAAVTARGVCWSTSLDPTTALSTKTNDGTGNGAFTSYITGLTPGTIYYVRAYATNSVGTAYGTQVTFTTGQTTTLPTVTTNSITNITQTTASGGGDVTSDGNATVTARGVCWSTSANPTISLSTRTTDGTGTGSFTSSLTNLSASTTYYVRAYATNSVGTAYGSNLSFTTTAGSGSTITDVDGNTYSTVTIGTQVWMTSNLKTTKFNDGTAIPLVTDNSTWTWTSTPGYSWYNNAAANKNTYGALYNWYTVSTLILCPTGWHVPSDAEWTTLTTYLGGESLAGGELKETGTTHWLSPNTGATNASGFTAVPGGLRDNYGSFFYVGIGGYWWTSSEYGSYSWGRSILNDKSNVNRNYTYRRYGFTVRCLKD